MTKAPSHAREREECQTTQTQTARRLKRPSTEQPHPLSTPLDPTARQKDGILLEPGEHAARSPLQLALLLLVFPSFYCEGSCERAKGDFEVPGGIASVFLLAIQNKV